VKLPSYEHAKMYLAIAAINQVVIKTFKMLIFQMEGCAFKICLSHMGLQKLQIFT